MKYKFKPYSKNIIFFDTEFSDLDPYTGEILSIGMVKLDGRELYLELEYEGKASNWVSENILPTLTKKKVSREKAVKKIAEFIGKGVPYLVAYANNLDFTFLKKLVPESERTFHWLPIDFASILFGNGINPEAYYHGDKDNFFAEIGVDASKYSEHNALDDAKLLREVYQKMVSN